jgi:ADP-L-glycero-D-manno-heptose 6-epimerase
MILVTGGAGFIGSNLVASLNDGGVTEIAVNDHLGSLAKERNLKNRRYSGIVSPDELFRWLDGRKLEAILHMGAISSTTATDEKAVMEANFELPMRLLDWCTATRTPFIYASSAATYGDGSQGFDDDDRPEALRASSRSISMDAASCVSILRSRSVRVRRRPCRRNGAA